MTLTPNVILKAGRDQSANVAFIPNRLVVLYSTQRSEFLRKQIERGEMI